VALAANSDVVVVVDVLSFSTTVSVALAHGLSIYPRAWRDPDSERFAAEKGALLAGRRGDCVSLSPRTMTTLESGTAVVLPSPNGAACCLAAEAAGTDVIIASLRNAPAVARWLQMAGGDVGIVAAGERWPDGSLRPAYEDWVGAGAVVEHLGAAVARSAEAEAAAAAARVRRPLAEVASGVELVEPGYGDDVAMAEQFGIDDVIPRLRQGRVAPA
jgi:2-phosphosulfolactate phosphatase